MFLVRLGPLGGGEHLLDDTDKSQAGHPQRPFTWEFLKVKVEFIKREIEVFHAKARHAESSAP